MARTQGMADPSGLGTVNHAFIGGLKIVLLNHFGIKTINQNTNKYEICLYMLIQKLIRIIGKHIPDHFLYS